MVTTTKRPHRNTAASPQPTTAASPIPKRMLTKLYIGIDPGSNTGIAIYEAGGITQMRSGAHCEMLLQVYGLAQTEGLLIEVILEDVHADSTNFVAAQFIAKMMKTPAIIKQIPNDKARMSYCINAACKRSRDSGMAAGLSADWKAFLDSNRIPYSTLAPSERDNAETLFKKAGKANINPNAVIRSLIAPTKLNAAQFKALTGYAGSTNEHTRDAGTLVWWYAKQQEKVQNN